MKGERNTDFFPELDMCGKVMNHMNGIAAFEHYA